MNLNELVKLAKEATGGGVTYSVTISFNGDADGNNEMDLEVWRWDSINHLGVWYSDAKYELMRNTIYCDDPSYAPLADAIKEMRKDAVLMSSTKDLEKHTKYTAHGIKTRRRIIDAIRSYTIAHKMPPSRADVANLAGLECAETSLVYIFRDMRSDGLIDFRDGVSRSITINEEVVRKWLEELDTI